jgi:predicted membrane-bound spermidine synthase
MGSSRAGSGQKGWGVLFLLFFLSGISGLIYESIWSRYIRLFVGSAATAQILVLALFMGGMSMGAFLAGRHVNKLRAPIVVYGVIEGLVGLYALAFPHLFEAMMRFAYDVVFPAVGGGAGVTIAKWSLAASLILPPCVMLGTTFPLMSVGILRRDFKRSGEILSMLYFCNSFGAAFGAVFSGFVLVAKVGLPGALMVAAALNISIMLVAMREKTDAPPIVDRTAAVERETNTRAPLVLLFLGVAFGTGLSSFLYEIGWIRLLSMILGSATHSFEVMLSAFIFGLALGGLWVRKRMDKFKHPELTLGIVQLVMGISAIATLPAYWLAVQAVGGLLGGEGERTMELWYQFNILRYLLCLLIMLPATFCAGMTLPLLTHVMLKRGQSEAIVGKVYALNTLGAIVGAVAAGLILMPIVGLKGVIVLGALFDMLLGLALLRNEITSGRAARLASRLLPSAALGSLLMLGFGLIYPVDPMVLTATVFRRGRRELPEYYDILSYVDGRTASVTVVDNTDHPTYHIIYTNGKPDASVILDRWPADRDPDFGPDIAGDEPNQFLVGIVPLMARPDATHGALIGFGSGVTCHTVLGSPNLERLDTVEIEPEMVRGSEFFRPVNYRAYEDPRSHIYFDDAKAYFATAGYKYDFIISEPTNPWVSGVSSLFTVEFYREAKRYLKPGGVLAQWLQGYELSDELLMSVLAALDQEFADYLIVRIGNRDWVIVSSPDGRLGQLSDAVFGWPDMQESFELLGIHDVGQIDGLITANKQMLHPFIKDRTPNRDVMPLLDTGAEKERFMRSSAEFLHELRWTPAPLIEVLGGISRRPYPTAGIGDLRDTHILFESELAMLLMRRYEDPTTPEPIELSAADMDIWRSSTDLLEAADPDWNGWLSATYEIFRLTASHFGVHETAWWDEAMAVGASEQAPTLVRSSMELMDALSRQDGARIREAVDLALVTPDFPLPDTFVTTAGVVALELVRAPAEQRRGFADRHMTQLHTGTSNADYAFQVIRAYAQR